MTKGSPKTPRTPAMRAASKPARGPAEYHGLLGEIGALLEEARRASARAVNSILTGTYWEIGRRIVEHEQQGAPRAEYGRGLLKRLAADLTARFGRGFGGVNLSQMKRFYRLWPAHEILQTPSGKSGPSDTTATKLVFPTSSEEPEFARYALDNLPNKVLAADCLSVLPDEEVIASELKHTRRILEGCWLGKRGGR